MTWHDHDTARGLDDLRAAVLAVLGLRPDPAAQPAGVPAWLLQSEAGVGGDSFGIDPKTLDRKIQGYGIAPELYR